MHKCKSVGEREFLDFLVCSRFAKDVRMVQKVEKGNKFYFWY